MLRPAGKEHFDGHFENFSNLIEATATDPTGAFFVFLDLLKRDAELGTKLLLCTSGRQAVHSNILADNPIDAGR